jgi:hypothetical protein
MNVLLVIIGFSIYFETKTKNRECGRVKAKDNEKAQVVSAGQNA